MKSYHFSWTASLGIITALMLGCAQESVTQQSPSPVTSPVAESPVAVSPATETAQASNSAVLSSGSFVSGEHPTQGAVRIKTENGKRVLELDSTFQTSSMGPDLVIALHRSEDVIGVTQPPAYAIQEGDYVVLAPLRNFTGAQTYEIPNSVVLENFKSAVIWCRRFNATFGAATLKS